MRALEVVNLLRVGVIRTDKAGIFFLPLFFVLPPLIFRGKNDSGDGDAQ